MRRFTLATLAVLCGVASAQTGTHFSPAQLAERVVHRRAVEAVIWGMPAVNFDLMYQAAVQARGSWNQVVYWSRLPDWKIQTLTPNPDAIYLTPFINTKDAGPVPSRFGAESFDVGTDAGSPVSEDYRAPFAYAGTIRKVQIRLAPSKLSASDHEKVRHAARKAAMAIE